MDTATRHLIEEAANGSAEGRLHFGEVIDVLTRAGVDSYTADYRAERTTYYLRDEPPLDLPLPSPGTPIADAFDAAALRAAIRGAQRGEVMYPAFKELTRAAGCVGYTVWITGRHVAYYGRRGETHVERFPD
ncbi:DUF1398 family protein [Stenotrophomonas sp. HITSZ_GD]|uniref:DUF1398 family protein n=1 Tax=Stenotrophomonas sp. HITSZ_GD TaxID=3037248 RepID=UPI00240D0E0B|nr:DUF1398 family protein [Stenotrophomonas sp. HITSZ_GD]MDG2524730.1 DUF1398 family protein [Stenotrophomonas sp. HITSZ_GD]